MSSDDTVLTRVSEHNWATCFSLLVVIVCRVDYFHDFSYIKSYKNRNLILTYQRSRYEWSSDETNVKLIIDPEWYMVGTVVLTLSLTRKKQESECKLEMVLALLLVVGECKY